MKELLETIKDTSRDYVGTNGCLYQDITREELDLILNEIERLNNRIDKAIDYIMTNHCLHLLDKSIINSKELIDILKGSDSNE